jgi:hypothetical protein
MVRICRLIGYGESIHVAMGAGIQTVILGRSEVATRLVLGKSDLGFYVWFYRSVSPAGVPYGGSSSTIWLH